MVLDWLVRNTEKFESETFRSSVSNFVNLFQLCSMLFNFELSSLKAINFSNVPTILKVFLEITYVMIHNLWKSELSKLTSIFLFQMFQLFIFFQSHFTTAYKTAKLCFDSASSWLLSPVFNNGSMVSKREQNMSAKWGVKRRNQSVILTMLELEIEITKMMFKCANSILKLSVS